MQTYSSQQLDTQSGTVAKTLTLLQMYYVTLNQTMICQIGKSLYPMNELSQQFNGIIKSQVILEVKDFMNTYVSDIIIKI